MAHWERDGGWGGGKTERSQGDEAHRERRQKWNEGLGMRRKKEELDRNVNEDRKGMKTRGRESGAVTCIHHIFHAFNSSLPPACVL